MVSLNTELAKRNNVMNVELSRQFGFGFSASLAGVIIAAASVATLRKPVLAVIGNKTTLPCCAVFARRISRLSLPSGAAGGATKITGVFSGWQSVEGNSACLANERRAFSVLNVVFTLWAMFGKPFIATFGIAKRVRELRGPGLLSCHWFSALVTRLGNLAVFSIVSTFDAAEFLFGMVAGRKKHFSAMLARLREYFTDGLSRAISRAKAALPVFSFLKRFTAEVALFHAPYYTLVSAQAQR